MQRVIKQAVPERDPRRKQIISVDTEGWNIPLTDGIVSANPFVAERGWHSDVMICAADDRGFARSLVHDGSRREAEPGYARNYGISTEDMCEFLLDLPHHALVVSFAFSYDETKIFADLSDKQMRELSRDTINTDDWERERTERMQYIYETFGISYNVMRGDFGPMQGFHYVDAGTTIYKDRYWIAYTPRKVLHIVDLAAGKIKYQNVSPEGKIYPKVEERWARSVTVWDAFGYFQKSFVKALADYRCGSCDACKRAREHCKAKCKQCATVNACQTAPWTPEDIERIAAMKEHRGVFNAEEQSQILEYCFTECRYLSFLFRDLYVNIDDYDTEMRKKMGRFDGTGSVAAAWMKVHDTKKYLPKREPGEAEYLATQRSTNPVTGQTTDMQHDSKTCLMCCEDASKYNHCSFCGTVFASLTALTDHLTEVDAKLSGLPEHVALSAYFGGRFEVSEIGYVGNLFGYDINSAYPHVARTLPCLAHGSFRRVNDYVPGKFGVYLAGSKTSGRYAPFPFRTEVKVPGKELTGSAIYYGHGGKRWIWSHANPELSELAIARKHYGTEAIPVYDGYVWEQECECASPFAAIPDMYAERQEYVLQGNGMEKVIKLILNSLYGKTAQSIGWGTDKNGVPHPPPFQCFIWAGMITSGCRAMILNAINQDDADVISIATDGILSRTPISGLDIPKEKILGAWDYTPVEDGYMFQSGVYTFLSWNKYDQEWKRTYKTRGFSAKEIPAEVLIAEYMADNMTVHADPKHSRFIPMRSGISRTDALEYIGQWVPSIHDVSFKHARRVARTEFDELGIPCNEENIIRHSDPVTIGCRECEQCKSHHQELCINPPLSMAYEPKQSWKDVLDSQPDMSDLDYLDDETGNETVPHE